MFFVVHSCCTLWKWTVDCSLVPESTSADLKVQTARWLSYTTTRQEKYDRVIIMRCRVHEFSISRITCGMVEETYFKTGTISQRPCREFPFICIFRRIMRQTNFQQGLSLSKICIMVKLTIWGHWRQTGLASDVRSGPHEGIWMWNGRECSTMRDNKCNIGQHAVNAEGVLLRHEGWSRKGQ